MPFGRAHLRPLRVLLWRALVGYPMLRVMAIVVAALVTAVADGPGVAELDSPPTIVVLAMLLGVIDIRRRGERFLWANLGYPPAATGAIFGGVALVGECLLAAVRT